MFFVLGVEICWVSRQDDLFYCINICSSVETRISGCGSADMSAWWFHLIFLRPRGFGFRKPQTMGWGYVIRQQPYPVKYQTSQPYLRLRYGKSISTAQQPSNVFLIRTWSDKSSPNDIEQRLCYNTPTCWTWSLQRRGDDAMMGRGLGSG